MAAGQNATYGSTLSPPRLAQLRQIFAQYRESVTMDQDVIFQLWAPMIAKQLRIDTSQEGEMERMYEHLADTPLLANKGEKARLLGPFGRRVATWLSAN